MIRNLFAAVAITALASACSAQVDPKWEIHDRNRPNPPVITSGTASTQEAPGKPPSDAIVLFDGKDLSKWVQKKDGSPAQWKVESGYFEVAAKTGDIRTKEGFGDCQLHVEFREPDPPKGEDQDRGNSGVFLMGLYEIQVLDSYNSKTYADGQVSAVYGQYPPLVNAARAAGQWQNSLAPRMLPSSTTASSRRTMSNSPAPPGITSARLTRQVQKNSPWPFRTTTIPSATATSGSANSGRHNQPPSTSPHKLP